MQYFVYCSYKIDLLHNFEPLSFVTGHISHQKHDLVNQNDISLLLIENLVDNLKKLWRQNAIDNLIISICDVRQNPTCLKLESSDLVRAWTGENLHYHMQEVGVVHKMYKVLILYVYLRTDFLTNFGYYC